MECGSRLTILQLLLLFACFKVLNVKNIFNLNPSVHENPSAESITQLLTDKSDDTKVTTTTQWTIFCSDAGDCYVYIPEHMTHSG